MTASANRSKGDQDPAEWLPQLGQCRYVRQWVAVKTRWHLSVDAAEKRALTARAHKCPGCHVRLAGTTTTSAASVTQSSGTSTPSTSPSGTDPRFAYCYQAIAAGYGP